MAGAYPRVVHNVRGDVNRLESRVSFNTAGNHVDQIG